MSMVFLLCSVLVHAAPPEFLRPVDQAVEDLDPLARSTRILQPGLVIYGQDSRLFAHFDPQDPHNLNQLAPPTHYYRFERGYQMRVNRMQYMVPTNEGIRRNVASSFDGHFRELAPANTVFLLKPVAPPTPAPPAQVNPHQVQSAPIDYRINARIDGRITPRSDAALPRNRAQCCTYHDASLDSSHFLRAAPVRKRTR